MIHGGGCGAQDNSPAGPRSLIKAGAAPPEAWGCSGPAAAAHQPALGRGAGRYADVLAVLRAGRGEWKTQDDWFEEMVASWNAQNERQVELVFVPNTDYMDGTKLPTAFAAGEGPDLFIISPATSSATTTGACCRT